MTYPEARVTTRYLCGRHYEELETAGGVIAAPPAVGRRERFAVEGDSAAAGRLTPAP
jgi:hypothetical protein